MPEIEPVNAPARTLITYADALARVSEAVEGREDYINAVKASGDSYSEWETCQYLEAAGDAPSCVIGTAFFAELIESGLTPDSKQNTTSACALFDARDGVLALGGYDVTEKALAFMNAVQGRQDTGDTWGAALAYGIAVVEGDDSAEYDDKIAESDPLHVI